MKKYRDLLDALSVEKCKSEEAVKASFIKYAGFPAYIRDKVDLYVGSTLFEFKYDVNNLETNYPPVLAQAMVYLRRMLRGEINLAVPANIVLVDRNGGLIFHVTEELMAIAETDTFKWDRPASNPDRRLIKAIRNLNPEKIFFPIESENSLKEFIESINRLNDEFPPAKRVVSEQNFEEVFEHWCENFGECFPEEVVLGMFFIAELLEQVFWDSTIGILLFYSIGNLKVEVPNRDYESFWQSYARPPAAEIHEFIMERAHLFVPVPERRFTGAFYTPIPVAEKAYEYLNEVLGENWEDEYYVWDPACGTGNLQVPHRRTDRLFMSTLNIEEVLMLKAGDYFPGAEVFQFDFLNDSIDKLPETLKDIIKNQSHRLLILMNPPYADAGDGIGLGGSKKGVAQTKVGERMALENYGAARNELSNQFIYRVAADFPGVTFAVYSKLKIFTGTDSKTMRNLLRVNHSTAGGFIVPGKIFPGVEGLFPIAISLWLPKIKEKEKALFSYFDVYNLQLNKVGQKYISISEPEYAINWFIRPTNTVPAVPLKGFGVKEGPVRLTKLPKNAFGFAEISPDIALSRSCLLVSSAHWHGCGSAVTSETFEKVLISLAVRHIPKPTWVNDRDQFEIPFCDREDSPSNITNLSEEFINDSIVWILFHGQNRSTAMTVEWEGKERWIENEFYPFPRDRVKRWMPNSLAAHRAMDRRRGETFVCNWLTERAGQFSEEAQAILDAGYRVYEKFYAELPALHRAKWKLGFWNPGWYQIRMSLKEHLGNSFPELDALTEASRTMRAKLQPLIYEYGFLAPEILYGESEDEPEEDK